MRFKKLLLVFLIIFISIAVISCGGGTTGGGGGGTGGGGDTGGDTGGDNTGGDTGGDTGTSLGYGSIQGRVIYANSKFPVVGAYVWLIDSSYQFIYQVTIADYNGAYRFDGVSAGTMALEADDYSTWTYVIDFVNVIANQITQKDLYIGGGSSSTPASGSYTFNNFSSSSRGVLVLSSHQKNNSTFVSVENLSQSSSSYSSKNLKIKPILDLKEKEKFIPFGIKDLPKEIQEKSLKLVKSQKIAKLSLKEAKSYSVGSATTFKVLDFDYYYQNNVERFVDIQAKCYAVGPHCYVFIDTSSSSSNGGMDEQTRTTVAQSVLTHVETDNSPYKRGEGIYSVNHRYFGTEWNPGIDNDSHMFILISPMLGRTGLLGYFYGIDELQRNSNNPNSNEKEIVYLNDNLWAGNMYYGLAALTHEFQHLINFNMKYINSNGQNLDEITINEGCSMLAEELNGFILAGGAGYYGNGLTIASINYFLNDTSTFEFFNWQSSSYGPAFMFMLYIYERFGENTLKAIAQSSDVGINNLAGKTGMSFDELFREWCLANYYTQIAGNPTLPSGNAHTRYNLLNTTGSYVCYEGLDNSSIKTFNLGGVTFASSFDSYPSNSDISLGKYNVKYVKYTNSGNSFNLKINYSCGEENKLHSNFILEASSGTFSGLQ